MIIKIPPILSPNTKAKIPRIKMVTPLNRTLVLDFLIVPVAIKTNNPTTNAITGFSHEPPTEYPQNEGQKPIDTPRLNKAFNKAKTANITTIKPPIMLKSFGKLLAIQLFNHKLL